MFTFMTFAVLSVLLFSSCISDPTFSPEEYDFDNYNRVVGQILTRYEERSKPFIPPPPKESSKHIEVYFSWTPKNILMFNEHEQYVEFRGLMEAKWLDQRLQWNYSNTGIDHVEIPIAKVWNPQMALDESREHDFASIFIENKLISVYHNGYVSWKSPVKTSSSCQIVQKSFPYNMQACKFTFASVFAYHTEIKFNYLNSSRVNGIITDGTWEIEEVIVPDCPEKIKFRNRTAIRFVVHMKRHFPQHYVINYAMPPILISLFLDLVSFLPPLSQQRIPLVIATVLALLFYMRSVDNRGPPSEVSLLGWFIFATVAEGLIVTFFSIWSIRIQYNYSLWRFFNNSRLYLGNFLCTLKTKAKNLLRRRRGNSLETIAILPINQASTNNVNPPTTTPGSANESYTQPDTTERREAILGDETENVNSENFDHIVAFAVIILKIVMVLIFIHLFKTVENDPLEYVQCTDEYYHE